MLGTYANNIYLLERLDYFCDVAVIVNNRLPHILMLVYCVVIRNNVTNMLAALTILMIIFEMVPTFQWKVHKGVKSKILLEQGPHLKIVYVLCLLGMMLLSIVKTLLLGMFFLSKELNSTYLGYVTDPAVGTTNTMMIRSVLRQGGFTLIAEGLLIFFIANTIKRYRPHVVSVKDVIFYKARMEFWMNFVSPVFEIIVFLTVAYMRNFFGFVMAFFTCLASFCQIPSFYRQHSYKVLTFCLFTIFAWAIFWCSLLASTANSLAPAYFRDTLGMSTKDVRKYLGAYIPYKLHDYLNCRIIDISNVDIDFYFNFLTMVFAFTSGFILYYLKLGSLSDTEFKFQIEDVMPLPPDSTFQQTSPDLEKDIKDSHYINYFLKKISLIFDLDIKETIDESGAICVDFIKSIPYLDTRALSKKIRLFTNFRYKYEDQTESTTRQILRRTWELVWDTVVNIFTMSNVVYASLFGYVAFFFYFKNQNPSLFSFMPFIGIFLLGISQFKTFIFYSQFLVGVPMIINFMLFYFSNIELDIANCEDTNTSKFYCQSWFGTIRRRAATASSPGKLFREMLVKIALFQGIFFFYRMLKFTGDLFVEKSDKALNLEIEDNFNRGNLPFIKIVLIQIASKFFVICFILMLYIGTSDPTYTNMCLLILAIAYMTKFKLVKKQWIIVYVVMNLIFISAYFIDLFLSTKDKNDNALLLFLLGLPINSVDSPTGQTNKLNEKSTWNKVMVMALYICCLVQQIAGRNRYIKCYLIKLDKVKNDNWLVQNVNNWKQKLKNIIVKVYYKFGIWLSYALNLYLPLFQSISIFRGFLFISIIVTFIVHINALRQSRNSGRIYLNTTYLCWKIFLILKVVNLSLMIVGAFGLNEKIRDYLGIVKDSQDYEFINYIGIESLESDIIAIIPTLQNCSTNQYIMANKLRFYFIAECVTFIVTKIAMKIIQIQRLYNNNLFGFVTSLQALVMLKTSKPKLYRIYKIYNRYIIGGNLLKSKKTSKLFNNFSSFLARVYTSLIYFITLYISVFWNISLLMFVSLYYFLTYFIRMNKIFLNYLTHESVERVVELKFENFYEKYLSRQALMHEDGVNANILKDDKLEKDNNPKFTNEEVRKYTRINLFSLALKLRLSITKYDGDNKYRLFLVSLTVTTSILVLTYLNAILQNIFWNTSKMQTFIKWLKIISTISGFRYYRNASTCLGNDLLPFLCLFILLAYDVYVIRIIASLQKDIRVKIESLENVDDEFKRESGKTQINELTEKDILRLDEKADQKDKDSDVDSDEKEDDFKDIFTLELGADEKELILDKIDFNTLINPEDLSNNKDIELALLDDQDRQEIKIRALKKGNEESLKKYTCYDTLEYLDLHRWNFYEFYLISTNNDEKNFKKHMLDMRKFKNRKEHSSSDSENQGDNESGEVKFGKEDDLKNKDIYPNMSEKHNILIYYYRNVKKLSILRILKFILDVQQRFIGAIFVLIVLRKTTLAVVLVYWLYIGYFYYSDHNAKQLKITNMFIAVITLLQYTIILLQQNIPSKDVNNLDENVILIDYLWLLLFPNLVKAQYLSNRFNAIFKIVGIVGLDQKTLLYDSIPTILFQITIFYYDFFLLFCAERLETVYLRIRREIFFIQSDPMGKILYMINYKNWKDPMTKLLLSVTSIAIVRLIEIVVIVLLVLNIFYASPIWNFFRLGLLFFMYSNIAFRPLSEADLVRTRLQRILFLAVVYLWVRVVITSCIDVYISLLPAGTIPPQLIQLLRIEMGEKFILVVEFFLLEYTSSVYFSQEFKNVAAKIIKKKVIRSQIIATCMSYELNEDKLMKYIEGFSQRIKLENDIMTLNKAIGDWKIGRTSQAIKSMAGVGTDDAEGETYELKNKESLQKLSQTSTFKSKMVFGTYQFLMNLRNNFFSHNILKLYDYMLLRNREIVNNKEIDIREYLAGNYDIMDSNLKHIQKVYQMYIDDAIRQEYNSVELGDVLKRSNIKRDIQKVLGGMGPLMALATLPSNSLLRSRSRSRGAQAPLRRADTQDPEGESKADKFDFNVLTINTEAASNSSSDGKHVFYNMLVENEIATKFYQKIKIEVMLVLFADALFSNWHYCCYLIMVIYTFVNGGINGFLYSAALIVLVLVEENLPSLIFWKMCFFNTVIGFSLKLMFTVFAEKLVDAKIISQAMKDYVHTISFLIIGSTSYIFEIFIMIFILIELVLIDELGFKRKKIIDCEDTNIAYIRMKINKVFNLREGEEFRTYKLYLRALYESIKDINNESANRKKVIKNQNQRRSPSLSPAKTGRTRGVVEERDEIDIEEVIAYEKAQYAKKSEQLKETIKIIEKNIFIKSFGKFSEENTKSFRWQLFSVFNRKPGIDLSFMLNFLMFAVMIYAIVFIDKMSGGTSSFTDQVVAASIVNQSLIWTMVLGISLMIIERMIYKRNPKEWREYFQYKDKKFNHPLTIEELNFALKQGLKEGKTLQELSFETLEYDEQAHLEELAVLAGKSKKKSKTVAKKKRHDDSYLKNPLLARYIFLIIITVAVTFMCGIYLPIVYTQLRVNANIFNLSEYQSTATSTSNLQFMYFQSFWLYQVFYAFFMAYLIISALQIKLGEPINKGRRELLSKFNLAYKIINKVIRVIPFFFTISIAIDFMLTTTSMDIWDWFKFESIYEQLYSDITEIKSKDDIIPGLKLGKGTQLSFGLSMALTQIIVLILPFILFGKYSSEKNKVELVTLNIDLITGQSKNTLYSGLSARSINDMLDAPYKETFQSSTNSQASGIPQTAMQVISFYEKSSIDFRITLDQLDQNLRDLVDAKSRGIEIKLLLTLNYLQRSTLKNTNAKREEKTFRTEVVLNQSQINQIVQMYSNIRNIGSTNVDRTSSILSTIQLDFTAGVLIKIPNVGNAAYYPDSGNSFLKTQARLSIDYIESDYLMRNRDLRWTLRTNNPFSGQWGDKNSFYFIAVVDDSGSSFFSSFTDGLTIIGLYTTLIYVIGQSIAKFLKVMPDAIWVEDIPRAEPLMKLCEAIAIARAEEDLISEVNMYYSLIDLMRSPELIKKIGDDYLSYMMHLRSQLIKQQAWIVKRDMIVEEKKKLEERKHKKGRDNKKAK